MSTLTEIETAVDALPAEEKLELYQYLVGRLAGSNGTPNAGASHSLLDIAPVRLGQLRQPWPADDDLLGEMLEGR